MGVENVFDEIMADNFPKLKKETDIQLQETQTRWTQTDIPQRSIIIKMVKVKGKGRILKTSREKQRVIYMWTPIRLSADFSAETLQTIRKWDDIFKVMKEKHLQPRILYPARFSFRTERETSKKDFIIDKRLHQY